MKFFVQAGSLVTTVHVKIITHDEAVSLIVVVDYYFFLKMRSKIKDFV